MLKKSERVRKRPGVIFGSCDGEGALEALKTLIDMLAREAILGYCKRLSVVLHKDNSVSVCSYDRGLKLDESVTDEGRERWQEIFCSLPLAPREPDVDFYRAMEREQDSLFGYGSHILDYSNGSYCAFDLCCVQYVCEYMTLEAVRDGLRKKVRFVKGEPVTGIEREPSGEESKTLFKFRFDTEVFTSVDTDHQELGRYLQSLALTVQGLKCELAVEKEGIELSYQYADGIKGYASSLCTACCFVNEKQASGRDRYDRDGYKARVRAAVGFSQNGGQIRCFHNYRELKNGGTHLDAVLKKIEKAFMSAGLCHGISDCELSKALAEHTVVIIETNCSPFYAERTNGLHNSLSNKMIADMAGDLIDLGFVRCLKANKDKLGFIF